MVVAAEAPPINTGNFIGGALKNDFPWAVMVFTPSFMTLNPLGLMLQVCPKVSRPLIMLSTFSMMYCSGPWGQADKRHSTIRVKL